MKQEKLTVTENVRITADVCRMTLSGDVSAVTTPGQFLNLRLAGLYLRRPISVYDLHENAVTILYKIVGRGTAEMAALQPGAELDVLLGLGNGFDLSKAKENTLLIGGGIGVAPLHWLARQLHAHGKKITAVLGFNTASEILCEREFGRLCDDVLFATVDGSRGVKGFVTDAMQGLSYDYFYTCGPEAMLKAVYHASDSEGEFSFEERMGCGFGACLGCSCRTIAGEKRICKDGPVLGKGELLWAD